MSNILEQLPEDFYNSEEEKDIISKVEDWTMKPKVIASMLKERHGIVVSPFKLKGIKARIRHLLGQEAIPLQKLLKLKDMDSEIKKREYREQKLIESGGLLPLPIVTIDLNKASDKKELRYLIEYGIVMKMYKEYVDRKRSLNSYKEARKWFHDKYRE